jgi:AcrR family transcriptional regulator
MLPVVTKAAPGVRVRARRMIEKEIVAAANVLFLEKGFEATTMDEIAAAVGMSQRNMFRYFPTKGDIVLGKLDLLAHEMLTALLRRPLDEPVWICFRRAFDVVARHMTAAGRERVRPIEIVFNTPTLMAGYLQRFQHNQEAFVAALIERAQVTGTPYAADDPTPRVLTAAAFACLIAAQHSWLGNGAKGTLAKMIDRAMATLQPTAGVASSK